MLYVILKVALHGRNHKAQINPWSRLGTGCAVPCCRFQVDGMPAFGGGKSRFESDIGTKLPGEVKISINAWTQEFSGCKSRHRLPNTPRIAKYDIRARSGSSVAKANKAGIQPGPRLPIYGTGARVV